MDSCCKPSPNPDSRPFPPPIDCLMFDLDDTLYSTGSGIADSLRKNIEDFLVERCGIAAEKASALRAELFKTYGSSLVGLRALGYDVDADDYHSIVHGRLPYHLIKPDPQLRKLLRHISQRKIIFTNSDRIHATRVLKRLGMEDCFDQVVCFETMNPNLSNRSSLDVSPVILKPSPEAIRIAIRETHVDPHRTLFLDDNVRNVASGKAAGLRTVLVGKTGKTKEADYSLEAMINLPRVVPEIWANSTDREGRVRSEETQMDTIPTAATLVGA
ncbi:hypothetical protein MLD38_012014 [Melastoma candidum]|uniref:Uncharacterized protein n=1 Tax=Melastoma candidum TaxID=119954 RepID=A0ACB9RDC4_9MYRT|nr:hypothetical protein MLD38_012014 [Melastoma candidum]